MYEMKKVVSGFSTCFRQHSAESHCRFLHGYALEFEFTFRSEKLDSQNWVMDFGFLKQHEQFHGTLKNWMQSFFDHTTFVALDDPDLSYFRTLWKKKIIQLIAIEDVSCEKFAEMVFRKFEKIQMPETTFLYSVRCIENKNNSVTYYG